MSNIVPMPTFKTNATPHERFMELARWAEEHPDKVQEVVVVYRGVRCSDAEPEKRHGYHLTSSNCDVHTQLALLSMGARLAQDWALKP